MEDEQNKTIPDDEITNANTPVKLAELYERVTKLEENVAALQPKVQSKS